MKSQGRSLPPNYLPFERIDETLSHVPGMVSRKRQISPAVCEAIQLSR